MVTVCADRSAPTRLGVRVHVCECARVCAHIALHVCIVCVCMHMRSCVFTCVLHYVHVCVCVARVQHVRA